MQRVVLYRHNAGEKWKPYATCYSPEQERLMIWQARTRYPYAGLAVRDGKEAMRDPRVQ